MSYHQRSVGMFNANSQNISLHSTPLHSYTLWNETNDDNDDDKMKMKSKISFAKGKNSHLNAQLGINVDLNWARWLCFFILSPYVHIHFDRNVCIWRIAYLWIWMVERYGCVCLLNPYHQHSFYCYWRFFLCLKWKLQIQRKQMSTSSYTFKGFFVVKKIVIRISTNLFYYVININISWLFDIGCGRIFYWSHDVIYLLLLEWNVWIKCYCKLFRC